MKKVLLFAALLGMGSALMAQTPEKCKLTAEKALEKTQKINQQSRSENVFNESLDSIVYASEWNNYSESYEYDWKGNNLVTTTYSEWGHDRLVSTYENDLIATIEHHSKDVNATEWEHSATEIYTYDENGNLILFEYNALNFGEWGITDRYEYTYDEQGRLLTSQTWWYDFWGEVPQLLPNNREEYSYEGNTITIDIYGYYMETEDWHPTARNISTYNEDGDCSEDLQMSWDEATQDWKNEAKNVHGYDAEGHVTTITYSNWEEGEWVVTSQTVVEYEDGKLVATTTSDIYQTGELTPYLHDEYEYDEAGNRSVTKNFYYEEGELLQSSFNECIYDLTANSNEIMGCQDVWNGLLSGYFTNAADPITGILMANKWTQFNRFEYYDSSSTTVDVYYSATTGVNEDGEEIRVQVAGLDGKIYVKCDKPVEVHIYDMAGRNVATRNQVNECEISLKAGLYIVKAGDAAIKVVVR